MSQPGLQLPAYHTYYKRPVKMLATADGGMAAWQLDYTTGGWKPANDVIDEILFAVGGEIFGPMSKDEFIQFVEAARARYIAGEGPIFALYETTKALVHAPAQEGRTWTEVEKALIAGLRRKTYAMFEAELVRRGDPAADTAAAQEAGG